MLGIIKNSVIIGNYKYLKLQCYVCEGSDHISIDCPNFKKSFEGNIRTYFEKTRQSKYLFWIYTLVVIEKQQKEGEN